MMPKPTLGRLQQSSGQELQALGWSVRENAKDLGAQITYGKKKSVKEQQSRLDSLDRYWMLLNRTVVPEVQKCQVIFQAFWPRAFHGVANCTLGWSHIKSLRTSAMRALRYNRAGANPAIRLGLLTSSDEQAIQAFTNSGRSLLHSDAC